jgi:hypothetical protein
VSVDRRLCEIQVWSTTTPKGRARRGKAQRLGPKTWRCSRGAPRRSKQAAGREVQSGRSGPSSPRCRGERPIRGLETQLARSRPTRPGAQQPCESPSPSWPAPAGHPSFRPESAKPSRCQSAGVSDGSGTGSGWVGTQVNKGRVRRAKTSFAHCPSGRRGLRSAS